MTHEQPKLAEKMGQRWGMGWSALAEAADVPVSRIRNWRLYGGQLTTEELARIEELDLWLEEALAAGADEPAYELERILVNGYTAKGWDLYQNGEGKALLRIISGADPVAVLDDTFSDWRTRFDTAWEVFDADDGHKSIRPKSDYRAPRTY